MTPKISENSANSTGKIGQYVVCLIAFVIMIVIAYPLWAPYSPKRQPRGTASFSHMIFRSCAGPADQYYRKNGHFPPELNGSHFYGSMNEVFGKTVPVTFPPDHVKGSIVDPFREEAEFPNERPSVCMYNSPRNPDGWVKFKGYPLRYFRSAGGKWGMLLGNAPDGKATITEGLLSHLDAKTMLTTQTITALKPYTYDPSNGTWSAGDQWRLLEPPSSKTD